MTPVSWYRLILGATLLGIGGVLLFTGYDWWTLAVWAVAVWLLRGGQ